MSPAISLILSLQLSNTGASILRFGAYANLRPELEIARDKYGDKCHREPFDVAYPQIRRLQDLVAKNEAFVQRHGIDGMSQKELLFLWWECLQTRRSNHQEHAENAVEPDSHVGRVHLD